MMRVSANTQQHRLTASLCLLSLVIILLSLANPVHGQTPTDSPLPTKTPTPIPEQASTTPAFPTTFEPFTQADLSILTGNVQRPNGIVWHNGNLYASCTGDMTVYEINDTTGATLTYIWGIRNAHTLYAEDDEAGELALWIPDFQSNTLTRVTRQGVETISGDFAGPWGISYLDDESFLITNLLGDTLERVTRDGERTVVVGDLAAPTGVTHDDRYIYVANNGSTRRAIEWYALDPEGEGDDDSSPALVTGIQNTTGIVLGADGRLYFACSLGTRGVVGRVDPEQCRLNGGCSNDQVEVVLYTELAAPLAGLTLSPDMKLYVHTMFSPDIYWVQLED